MSSLDGLAQFIDKVIRAPETSVSASAPLSESIRQQLKAAFDQLVRHSHTKVLPELYVDGFDVEQIWSELQLQCDPVIEAAESKLGHTQPVSSSSSKDERVDQQQEDSDDSASDPLIGSDDDAEGDGDEDAETSDQTDTEHQGEDAGESAAESEEEEEQEQEKEGNGEDTADEDDDDDNIDYNAPLPSKKSRSKELKYEDWFGPKESHEMAVNDDNGSTSADEIVDGDGDAEHADKAESGIESAGDIDEDADENAQTAVKSRHQLEKERIKAQIRGIEDAALGDKPWVMTGEIEASARPVNSLLEATVDYEQAMKLSPEVTVEATMQLEDLIRQRIADSTWDDPVRKPANDVVRSAQPKGEDLLPEVSTEKSKEGLGDIYAKEYERTVMGVKGEDKVKTLEAACAELVSKLFVKLDALSNFHFTPRPPTHDVSVTPNVAAVAMEEVIPIGVSESVVRAPEEVYDKKTGRDGVLRTAGEMSTEERQAQRRAKKQARRSRLRQRAAGQRQAAAAAGLGAPTKNIVERIVKAPNVIVGGGVSAAASDKKRGRNSEPNASYSGAVASAGKGARLSTSTTFFSKLQDEARSKIRAVAGNDAAVPAGVSASRKGSQAITFKM